MKAFIPFVGNTHDLQTSRHELGRWFLDSVATVNGRPSKGETAQGFYVVAADGKAYLFNNNRSVERVLGVLDRGLAMFKRNPPIRVDIKAQSDMQPVPPKGTTILRIYSRIRPVPLGSDDSNENVQRDHFWVLPEEAAALKDLQVSDSLARRLARFAFVDAIRGEPDFWSKSDVRNANFTAERTASGKVALGGTFAMRTTDSKRGLEGRLQAEVDFGKDTIKSWLGYAEATAWGASTYTPNPPPGKFPIKFAMVVSPEDLTRVAPQGALYGPEYLRP